MRTIVGPGRLTALVLTLAFTGHAQAACPGNTCTIPGGGSPRTDCIAEFDGPTLNYPTSTPKLIQCTDGDPTCDADGIANGGCAIAVRICLNSADSRFPQCSASDVASVEVKNKPTSSPLYDPQLAVIQDAVNALGLPTNAAVCTDAQTFSVKMKIGAGLYKKTTKKLLVKAATSGGTRDADKIKVTCLPSATLPGTGRAYAKVIANAGERIEGQLSRAQIGDYLIANDRVQFAITAPGRLAYNAVGAYGGNLVDADLQRPDGSAERDSFETFAPGLNVENTVHYTNVTVLNDGSNSAPAVIRATGVDDLLDNINPSSVVANFGFTFPAAADDTDLPFYVTTDYILEPGKPYLRIETTVTNTSPTPKDIFFAEYVNGSGQVEMFQDSYGFGEPLVTACPNTASADLCHMIAYSGEDEADGVSYGYITGAGDKITSFSTSGVAVPLYNSDAIFTLIGLSGPNYTVGASGSPTESLTFTRYFAVGNGSVASVEDSRNEILGLGTGTIAGTVTAGGQPLANADVAVIGVTGDGRGANPNVVNHFRTDAAGKYQGTLRPGSYTVRANKDGRLASTPNPAAVNIAAGSVTTQDFTLPAQGTMRVQVVDENGDPVPAKVQLVGFDPYPGPKVTSTILIINNVTGMFGEESEDGLVHGIANVQFAGADGDTGSFPAEAGSYQVVVSRGPRYSAYTQNVTVTACATTTVNAQIAKVMDTPGFIGGDWHVHSIDSADAEVTREERVLTEMSEGMDFFTPSDHEVRNDFTPTITAMGVSNLIGTAPSAEITTFDYGHFNSWPVTVNPGALNGGTVDHGGAPVVPGQDFPAYGSYSLSPAQIIATAHADPKANLIQINHMKSHFNVEGLDIDTAEGLTGPPQSHKAASARRLDPGVPNFFTDTFDALEVWIGTDGRNGQNKDFIGENLGDWFNLLNQGILRSGVASSDTHQKRTTQINARTWVASSVTNPALLPAAAETLAANVVAGRALGTNAPFFTVDVTTPLGSAGHAIGDNTMVATNDGTATVTVNVKSPLWAQFDTIELYVNAPTQRYDHDANAGTRMRYRVPAPTQTQSAGVDFTVSTINDYPGIPNASHYEATATFNLTGLAADSWVVVMVKGTDGVSRPLFPVLPNSIKTSTNTNLAQLTDGNLGEDGIMALAFSNPLYIDANNDASWTAPGVQLVP